MSIPIAGHSSIAGSIGNNMPLAVKSWATVPMAAPYWDMPKDVPPQVKITAPLPGATVSGATVSVTADASDLVGVSGVQFKLDGLNLNAEDVAAAYSTVWNSTGAANGPHVLTAVARDAGGNLTSSPPVTVVVSN